jgi:hypothetical protein
MSVQKGDRGTYRGRPIIVLVETSFLKERRWVVKSRDGSVRSGWRQEVALESMITGVTTPSWEIGDSVKVGWHPHARKGTVSAIGTDEAGQILYTVDFPEDDTRETPERGTRWTIPEESTPFSAESIDTHT